MAVLRKRRRPSLASLSPRRRSPPRPSPPLRPRRRSPVPNPAGKPEPSAAQAKPSSPVPPGRPNGANPSAAQATTNPPAPQAKPNPSAAQAKPEAKSKPSAGEAKANPPADQQPKSGPAAEQPKSTVKAAPPSEPAVEQAGSQILINIDKSQQEMTVFVDGLEKYTWPVSTGKRGYSTPSGNYSALSMNETWYSKEWDNAPMPHAIFYMKDGHAIHGSYEVKHLGSPASHGCVRLSPKNATILYDLVKKNGLKNTQVVLAGTTPGGEAKVAAQPAYPEYGGGPWPGYGRGYYPPPPLLSAAAARPVWRLVPARRSAGLLPAAARLLPAGLLANERGRQHSSRLACRRRCAARCRAPRLARPAPPWPSVPRKEQ